MARNCHESCPLRAKRVLEDVILALAIAAVISLTITNNRRAVFKYKAT